MSHSLIIQLFRLKKQLALANKCLNETAEVVCSLTPLTSVYINNCETEIM